MKKLIKYVPILLAIPLVVWPFTRPAQAQQQARKHEAVVWWAETKLSSEAKQRGIPYAYDGAQIYCSSSSSGAPTFPQYEANRDDYNTTNLANVGESMALMMDLGYNLQHTTINDGSLVMVWTK